MLVCESGTERLLVSESDGCAVLACMDTAELVLLVRVRVRAQQQFQATAADLLGFRAPCGMQGSPLSVDRVKYLYLRACVRVQVKCLRERA